MGKKQHSKDRLFLTRSEWNAEWGGFKEAKDIKHAELPFYCCALSLQPFTHAYCTQDGYVFDLTAIYPYLRAFKKHPITGKPLSIKDLIKLKWYKNDENEYHCPITCKIFTKHTHIVAIKTTGNVYSYIAIKKLNISQNNYKDLMNSKPFDPKVDIITIQDPNKPKLFKIKKKTGNDNNTNDNNILNEPPKKKRKISEQNGNNNNNNNEERKHNIPLTLEFKEYKDGTELGLYNQYTTGNMAASFTSTLMPTLTKDKHVPYTAEQVRNAICKNVKGNGKKGLIRLVTNLGNLNFELHCDYVPETCYNFMLHAVKGTYNNIIFHRNIKGFMIQGGCPNGNGYGGKCAWNTKTGYFNDEFHKFLKHDIRGTLSMANHGLNTNGSQFFIIYDKCNHLDNKHSVFGKLVGGNNVLNKIELIKTDNKNKPLNDIILKKVIIYNNPFTRLLPHQLKVKKETELKNIEKLNKVKGKWWSDNNLFNNNDDNTVNNSNSIGKYININKIKNNNKNNKISKELNLPLPKNTIKDDNTNQNSIFRFKHFSNKI